MSLLETPVNTGSHAMGWSLGYLPTREPELLDRFFLSIGKALYLATEFEHKCRYVLRLCKLMEDFDDSGDFSASLARAAARKDPMLCATIIELKSFSPSEEADIELLRKAKDARNYIAHESAAGGHLSYISPRDIAESLVRLREQVLILAAGDNVVSRWVYEIEEKEHAPREIRDSYLQRVEKWVFGDP